MSKKELLRKEILIEVANGRLKLRDAAYKMGVGYRQAKRIIQRYKQEGDKGLIHRSRGKPSCRACSIVFKEQVLSAYQSEYLDFGPTFAAEKLKERQGLEINPETLRLWLLEEKLWCRHRKRKTYRQRRERRSKFGELLQIDGSIHRWFGPEHGFSCLLNIVDDATGITMSQMAGGETCQVLLSTLRAWIEKYGVPKAVYVDLKSLYVTRVPDQDTALHVFARVCRLLGIEIIKAYSPQAKGRVERNHGVYQDRLVKELRLHGITTIDGANQLLQESYLEEVNRKFAKTPASSEDAHSSKKAYGDLDQIFCFEYTRQVHNDFTVQFQNKCLQLVRGCNLQPRNKVQVRVHLNGNISIWYHDKNLEYKERTSVPLKVNQETKERSNSAIGELSRLNKHKSPWSQFNPRWLHGGVESKAT